MGAFFRFIWEVVNTWQGYIGIVAMVFSLADIAAARWKWKKFPIPAWVTFCAGTLFIVFSSFSAWDTQRQARLLAEKRLAEISLPRLSIAMDQIIVAKGAIPDQGVRVTMVTIVATIRNSGADSICENWSLQVHAEGKVGDAKAAYIGSYNFLMPERGVRISMPHSQQLSLKTFQNPIVRGGAERGFLQFQFTESAHDLLKKEQSQFELSCTDIQGAKVVVSRNWNRFTDSGNMVLLPGIDYEQTTIPKEQ